MNKINCFNIIKKNLIFCLLCCGINNISFGFTKYELQEKRNLEYFETIINNSNLDITINYSDTCYINIYADSNLTGLIKTDIKNKRLEISLKNGPGAYKKTMCKIEIFVKNLKEYQNNLSGGLSFFSKKVIDYLEIRNRENGIIKLDLNTTTLKISNFRNGSIIFNGSAQNLRLVNSGDGIINLKEINIENLFIANTSKGNIYASGYCNNVKIINTKGAFNGNNFKTNNLSIEGKGIVFINPNSTPNN